MDVPGEITRLPVKAGSEVLVDGYEEVEVRATVLVQFDDTDPGGEEPVEDAPLGFCNGSIGLIPMHGAWKDQSQKAAMIGAMIMDEAGDVLAEANGRFVSAVWVP